jgi:hypothetical protein
MLLRFSLMKDSAAERKERARARRALVKFACKLKARVGLIQWTREELHQRDYGAIRIMNPFQTWH